MLGKPLGVVVGMVLLGISTVGAADDRSAVDEVVKPFLKDKPHAGLVVGITRPTGQQILGYGQVTLDGKPQVPAGDTIFEIGSITKIFTGTLLADQVLAKSVRLDDPVQKYLPAELVVPRCDDRDITLLHLSTHTSSLPVQPPQIGLFALTTKDPANPYAEYDQARLKQTLADLKLTRPIGSQFEYSNLGVGLLGHALAQSAKAKNYEDLLIQRLAKPLDLPDTRFQLSAEQRKRLAPGHTEKGKPTSPWTFACLEACGGLRSTVCDLLVFSEVALGRKKSTLADAFRMAHEPWRETGRRGEFVGLGWFRQKFSKERTILWHNGGTGGYWSYLGVNPAKGVGVVILSNSAQPVDALGDSILKHLEKEDSK